MSKPPDQETHVEREQRLRLEAAQETLAAHGLTVEALAKEREYKKAVKQEAVVAAMDAEDELAEEERIRQALLQTGVLKREASPVTEAPLAGSSAKTPLLKGCYIGAPATFALDVALRTVNAAFGVDCCYLVGSALTRPDWRDVDIRLIMHDEAFAATFPDAGGHWEHDERWLLITVAVSAWLQAQTGLPVDFQIQPMTHANAAHSGPRSARGLVMRTASRNNGPR